jgi:hypothetical protein
MNLGRTLIILGLTMALCGVLVSLGGRLPFRPGKLPGDIVHQGKNFTIYFPWVTSLVLSVILSLLLWLFRR